MNRQSIGIRRKLKVQDIAPGCTSSSPFRFILVGNRVFFTADGGTTGGEPWTGRAAIVVHQTRRAISDLRDEVTDAKLLNGGSESRGIPAPVADELLEFASEIADTL